MHIVAVHGWQKDEAAVAKTIADALGLLVFEIRQKLAAGGPAVLASYADPQRAEALAGRLSQDGIPTLVIDTAAVRRMTPPSRVRRFVLEEKVLQVETFAGDSSAIDYGRIDLLLVATCISGQGQTSGTVTERKFSLGKTLLAGGIPMTKNVQREVPVVTAVRDETLWLYACGGIPVIFDRAVLNYDGLGAAMQLTRDLNFSRLKSELRRLAPQAHYDDRLLKRATLVRVLGPSLSPERDLDLALEILARSLRHLDASALTAGSVASSSLGKEGGVVRSKQRRSAVDDDADFG